MGCCRPLVLMTLAAGVGVATIAFAQGPPPTPRRPMPRPPAPDGRQIEAADGDTVIVDGDDRVLLVRRHHADVRVVVDAQARSILVIADWGTFDRPGPNGSVDRTWKFEGVGEGWPLGARWQGAVSILEPESLRTSSGVRADPLLLETPAGRVAFRAGSDPTPAGDSIVVTFARMQAGGREGASFDEAERDSMSPNATWSMSTMDFGRMAPGATPFAGGANGVVTSGVVAGAEIGLAPGARAPVRPQPIRRVDPVWPDPATMPGVRGVVTVVLTVGADGSVRDAVIQRGIPGFEAAALAAARQWRFVPTGIDAQPFEVSWPYPPPRR